MSKLLIRNICQPPDSNPYGTAHGAWIVKQMAHGGIYMTQLVSKGNAVLVESKVKYKNPCLLYTSPSPRDRQKSRMPSSA